MTDQTPSARLEMASRRGLPRELKYNPACHMGHAGQLQGQILEEAARCIRDRNQVTHAAIVHLMELGVPLDDIVMQHDQATGDTYLVHGDKRLVCIHAEYTVTDDGGAQYTVTAWPMWSCPERKAKQ